MLPLFPGGGGRGMERASGTDYALRGWKKKLLVIEQENSGWLIKIMFPGKVETPKNIGQKKRKALEFI